VHPAAEVRPHIRRDAPVVLPVERPAALRRLMAQTLVRRVRRRLPPGRPLIVWTYSPLPIIADATRMLGAEFLVYDWADDASEHVLFSGTARRRRIAEWEDEMARRADVVFVSSQELLRRRGPTNPRTHLVPHGMSTASGLAVPDAEVARLPGPRIGFVGTLSEWIDLDLLGDLAASHPEWSFVLIGPRRTHANRIRRLANVTVLSPRPHADVSGILAALDVALIPYRMAPAMTAASPIKLQEYLAQGLPVVSTDLPEVRRFAPPVEIASDAAGFAAAIERALASGRRVPHPGLTWEDRVDEMVAWVTKAILERAP
jgi:glycosyltransferase involved in cell wall biosynthesis